MNRRLGKSCFAYALLFIFALMLACSLCPRGGGPVPVAADLFWMPHLPDTVPPDTSMSARASPQARLSPCGQAYAMACPPRQMFLPASDFFSSDSRLSVFLTFPAVRNSVIPILALYMGGRAPPDGSAFLIEL